MPTLTDLAARRAALERARLWAAIFEAEAARRGLPPWPASAA